MLDFTTSTPSDPVAGNAAATSSDLALSYGLDGQWTWTPGLAHLSEAMADAATLWRSRLSRLGAMVEGAGARMNEVEIPAVGGVTAWPEGRADLVVASVPNLVGGLDDLEDAGTHGPLAIVLDPFLAGRVALPSNTAVLCVVGEIAVTLVPGRSRTLASGLAVAVERRGILAEGAATKARLLAKHLTQIKAVRCLPTKPVTGRFVVSTAVDPGVVLAEMRHSGVLGGVPAGLGEYPGGIVVTCRAEHSDADLRRHADALAAVVTSQPISR